MRKEDIKKLKDKVLYCLENFPKTRNSDIELTIRVWEEFHKKILKKTKTDEYGVYLKDIFILPREDNVKRVRAIIQNRQKQFLPTSLAVYLKRKGNEVTWREYMQNPERWDLQIMQSQMKI